MIGVAGYCFGYWNDGMMEGWKDGRMEEWRKWND
jgi:hypothetical protein